MVCSFFLFAFHYFQFCITYVHIELLDKYLPVVLLFLVWICCLEMKGLLPPHLTNSKSKFCPLFYLYIFHLLRSLYVIIQGYLSPPPLVKIGDVPFYYILYPDLDSSAFLLSKYFRAIRLHLTTSIINCLLRFLRYCSKVVPFQ